jgi:hypothetical protein
MAKPGKFQGPFLNGASLTDDDLQYILQQTGSTTNCTLLSKNSVTPAQINEAFGQGQVEPPEDYEPGADMKASIAAWNEWRASKKRR